MPLALRHLLAIAALPFVVAMLVPMWLARGNGVALRLGTTTPKLLLQIAGALLLLIGLALFAASLQRFVRDGRGTLAPWDPPGQLVLGGPYRYVRNPMISGVIFLLFGEGLILTSVPHLEWAVTFLAINCVYIPLLEEPQLRQRFGDSYVEYCKHVPRFIPRLRP